MGLMFPFHEQLPRCPHCPPDMAWLWTQVAAAAGQAVTHDLGAQLVAGAEARRERDEARVQLVDERGRHREWERELLARAATMDRDLRIERDEAHAWARYYRSQVKHEGHPRGYICDKCRTFDALSAKWGGGPAVGVPGGRREEAAEGEEKKE